MKKVIITGANGQDGIILSKLLIKKKYLVYKFVKKKKQIKKITLSHPIKNLRK
jgi:N-acetyl-gamma-glutamylphosphate reductase